MSTYKDCQNRINNFSNIEMDNRDDTVGDGCLSPSNASPPDFDFNLPCRFFKSSFARSLSLNNATNNGSNNQCKSLDYDMRCNNTNTSNKLSCIKRDVTAGSALLPLQPQRSLNQTGSFYQQNEDNITSEHNHKQVEAGEEKPPALPARRPLSLHNLTLPQNLSVNDCQMNAEQKYQQNILTQLRQQAYKQATNIANNNTVLPVNGNNKTNSNSVYNIENQTDHSTGLQLPPHQQHQTTLNQKPQLHHYTASSNKNSSNSCNSSSVNNNNTKYNFRRNNNNNHIVWPKQQKNVEQEYNICTFDQANEDIARDELNKNYHDTAKLSTTNNYSNHFHNSHHMLNAIPIPTINIQSNQQQQLQQSQQHHQTSTYEILGDNTTNVEALILQNQVDTLQWQLKQVETSCDMYRAVMEEVVRFLERYQQSQKQLQQQQQQQLQQQQQQQATSHKHYNNNNKLEQIPRSKSLFQVYTAGGHEKSTAGNNVLDDTTLKPTTATSKSYLRARSSTNLIDLKQQTLNTSCNVKSKDDHMFESTLLPSSQSYSAFKDFTWRRSPKKSESRLNIAKDDMEEKLNQEAFRLLRTIQNLLTTSHHQPDLTHHRHSLGPLEASQQMGRLTKAISTTSVMTLPGLPTHNSTTVTVAGNSSSSLTTGSNTSPTTPTTANNAASNNLAPEMLFLRSTNMRDSRLSLRSSTDSSVHSTSSAASSASSKVETDEDPSTPFHPPPNVLTHKQHHHLAGSSTEDESGFSSISSFPDFGVTLNSTLLSNTNASSKGRIVGKELKTLKTNETDLQSVPADSRNSTLKANVVGLPTSSSHDMSHRWDSSSKTYHNPSNKFQKFSALTNDDSNTVLWV